MKILIAAGIFPPDIGGPAVYSKEITEEFNKQGLKTDIICYADQKGKKEYHFKVFRILRKSPLFLRYFFYFWQVLKIGRNYDIIYVQDPVSAGWPTSLAKKILRKKFIVKITGDYAWEQARNLGVYLGSLKDFQKQNFLGKINWLKKIEKRVCQWADLVIVPSRFLKEIVIGWGVKPNKIKVIYNTVRGNLNKPFLSQNRNLILSIGRLVPWKGFEALINLMPELLKINPDFQLMILGSGPFERRLKDLIVQLDLKDKVFIKEAKREEVLSCLGQSGLFVLNSDYEGLSHVILEAMTLGRPVIAARAGGNPELIQDGFNGFLVEYNNQKQLKEAILKLYDNHQLEEIFIKNSQKVLKKFNFEQMISQTIKAFQSLL